MARRRRKGRLLASLGEKLGMIRREVQQILQGLKREIARREADLATLKTEYGKAMRLMRGRMKAAAAAPKRVRRRAKRARPIDWERVYASLPSRFTLQTLLAHRVAGRRPKAHLYAIISRWKKGKQLATDPAGGYRKLASRLAKARKARPKPARTPKPAPRHEASPA